MLVDERIKTLQQKRAKKVYYETRKHELEQQRDLLERKVYDLRKEKDKEDADVEKLEGKSLLALFCQMTGSKEEKLSKEKQEAYAASLKYEAAQAELKAVEHDILMTVAELREIERESEEFERLLEEKRKQLQEDEQEVMNRILHMEGEIATVDYQIKEIKQALAAGKEVYVDLLKIERELKDAKDMSEIDFFVDSSYADFSKHQSIDSANKLIRQLQTKLRRFRTELADVEINAQIGVEVDEFTRDVDWFFDSIFVNLEVHSKIKNALKGAQGTKVQIEKTIERLEELCEKYSAQRCKLEIEVEELIVGA